MIVNYHGKDITIVYYSFLTALDFRLKRKPLNNQVINIVLSGDLGGGVTKLGFYIMNYPEALSPKNFSILANWIGKDNCTLIQKVMEQFDSELEVLYVKDHIFHYGQHKFRLWVILFNNVC